MALKIPETLLQAPKMSLWMSLWMLLHLFGHPVLATRTSVSGSFCGEDSQLHYAEFTEFILELFFLNRRELKIVKQMIIIISGKF